MKPLNASDPVTRLLVLNFQILSNTRGKDCAGTKGIVGDDAAINDIVFCVSCPRALLHILGHEIEASVDCVVRITHSVKME